MILTVWYASPPRDEQHHPHDIRAASQNLEPKAWPQARLEFSGRGRVGPAGPICIPRKESRDLREVLASARRRMRAR